MDDYAALISKKMAAEDTLRFKPKFERLEDNEWQMLVQMSPGVRSGVFASVAFGRPLRWLGEHHLAALILFELDPGIDGIEIMPEAVTVTIQGWRETFYPMFRLTMGGQTVVIDALAQSQYSSRDENLNWPVDALQRAYSAIGIGYKALREREVNAQPRMRNARAVVDGQAPVPCVATMDIIAKLLTRRGRHTIRTIVAALPDVPDVMATVFAMATHRWVNLTLWSATPGAMVVKLLPPGETRRQPTGLIPTQSTSKVGPPSVPQLDWWWLETENLPGYFVPADRFER
jgi:hypothetical protein